MYDSDCDKVKLKFISNTVIGCNIPKALLTMDTHNSLEAYIHTYLVESMESFMLVIDAWREDHSENKEAILGRS